MVLLFQRLWCEQHCCQQEFTYKGKLRNDHDKIPNFKLDPVFVGRALRKRCTRRGHLNLRLPIYYRGKSATTLEKSLASKKVSKRNK